MACKYMALNIIIPMAGKGARFQKEGYDVAKPFIEFNGKMMIEHVLDAMPLKGNILTLIIHQTFATRYKHQLHQLVVNYNAQFVSVEKVTAGAACTALAARTSIDKKMPVIFADSDNIFSNGVVLKFLDHAKQRKLDAALLTFPSDRDCYSYVEVDAHAQAVKLKEKEVISSHAIAGLYYFSRYMDFEDACIEMLIYNDKVKNEYYMSNVYNYAIHNHKKIGIFEITPDEFACVGTPEQLDAYKAICQK